MGVWERSCSFYIVCIVVTIDLGLPNGIRHTPNSGHDKEENGSVFIGFPEKESQNHTQVQKSSQEENGNSAKPPNDGTKGHGGRRITNSVANEHIANFTDSPGTGNVGLVTIKNYQ